MSGEIGGNALMDAESIQKRVDVDSDGILKCPCCGNTYLHQIIVDSTFRFAEDGAGVAVMHEDNCTSRSRMVPPTHIAGRRDNTYIYFLCEYGCTEKHTLALRVQQHKGQTILKWILSDRKSDSDGEVIH